MTNQAARMIDALIGDLGKNPQITPLEAIQTVILGVRKMQLGPEDAVGDGGCPGDADCSEGVLRDQ